MTFFLDRMTKLFGSVKLLHVFDLAADDGEFLVLPAASGSGKSTVLSMGAGLERISSGRIGPSSQANSALATSIISVIVFRCSELG
ncbi:ABC-type sugar transport system ATPase subunit [Sinorhizobium terangae]|uniref:ATP-binding cassette domain-containing protein n=1 Tax=Sinorhizobium terangae TaxID=110322 RepID=A0A6N7LRJ3_SINTE|nr:hypothetical protein [Sinorhizobium terangae]MBB4184383.1 ABC-type sugar transport system ATPase subunit [Sinorhizobium terangae]MQX19125.1 hypothetical protein [Sinorhizobium terangae]